MRYCPRQKPSPPGDFDRRRATTEHVYEHEEPRVKLCFGRNTTRDEIPLSRTDVRGS